MFIYIYIYTYYCKIYIYIILNNQSQTRKVSQQISNTAKMGVMFGQQTQPEVYGYNGSCWAPETMLWVVLVDSFGHPRGRSPPEMRLFRSGIMLRPSNSSEEYDGRFDVEILKIS